MTNNIKATEAWSHPLVIAFGGGVNSVAMLVGMHERGIKPDLILFADTGGEKPETYAYVEQFSRHIKAWGFPRVEPVQNDGMYKTLENNCLTKHMLPSLAYGFKSCSDKYKRRPQEKRYKQWAAENCVTKKPTKAIGYDADEPNRATNITDDANYLYWYPLIEWGWGRRECVDAIKRAKLCVPQKSACFYCPASKKSEILWLKKNHPDLFERAVQMERNAELTSIQGLGRSFSWEALGDADEQQFRMFPEVVIDEPCGCFDGVADDDE